MRLASACRHQGHFFACASALTLALTASPTEPDNPLGGALRGFLPPGMSGGSALMVKGEERDGTHTHHKKKPMKKNTKSNQSSVPVQHSHSTDTAAPAVKPDTRLPIDSAQRAENRKLDTAAVITRLRELLPTIAQQIGRAHV